MRTAIYVSALVISDSICHQTNTCHTDNDVIGFVGFLFLVFVVVDIVEFVNKMTQGDKK